VVMQVVNRTHRLILGIMGIVLLWPLDSLEIKVVLALLFTMYLSVSIFKFKHESVSDKRV
jgi:hypothetical protein